MLPLREVKVLSEVSRRDLKFENGGESIHSGQEVAGNVESLQKNQVHDRLDAHFSRLEILGFWKQCSYVSLDVKGHQGKGHQHIDFWYAGTGLPALLLCLNSYAFVTLLFQLKTGPGTWYLSLPVNSESIQRYPLRNRVLLLRNRMNNCVL